MNWVALTIGLVVSFYWAYVLKLIMRVRRQLVRPPMSSRLIQSGAHTRFIWFPAIFVWIVHPFVSAWLVDPTPLLRPLFDQPGVAIGAMIVAISAVGATVVCWKQMGSSWRIGIDPNETTRLVVGGPYAYVRHPIYSLSSLMMAATVIAIPSPLMMVTGLIHIALLQWEARREEQYLLHAHGQQYGDYLKHVGRFMPKSLLPYQSQR